MSQKCVEMIFGRLATDEELRREFRRDPQGTLGKLAACGVELTTAERDALLATNGALFERLAETIDPRLQKASLRPNEAQSPGAERRPRAEKRPGAEGRPS
ncbi:MAG: Os1348 family NHLP clan protein [Thermoanaerobaculia bacterium]|nr:Os1348 family NHLP clan protein [Thermoanaerobaculia bacterium]